MAAMPMLSAYTLYGGSFEEDVLPYHNMMGMAPSYPNASWTGGDPTFHTVPDEQPHLHYPKMTMPLPLASPSPYGPPANTHLGDSPIAFDHPFHYGAMGYHTTFSASRDQRYHSPTGPMGGSLSDASSEYGVGSDAAHRAMSFGGSPTTSHVLGPMPAESPLGHPGMWAMSPASHPLLSPTDELVPTMDAIAMKELEFESPGTATVDHHCFDGSADATGQIPLPLQLSPEELDLSEGPATHPALSGTTPEASQTAESSDYDTMASVYDNESDSDFKPGKRRHSIKTGSSNHLHGRQSSTASVRSTRHHGSNRSVLGNVSRVQKVKGPMAPRPSAKEKTRSKVHHYRTTSIGPHQGEKASKAFPCAFHHFGCIAVFANKNEWKRHNYSQHLKLDFYRCDLGSCNPDYNPKLIITPEKRRCGGESEDPSPDEEREIIYNDFNRKDLFTQHCRRMHGPQRYYLDTTTATNQSIVARASPSQSGHSSKSKSKLTITKDDEAAFESELENIRARCHMIRRKAPSRSRCGFCNRIFEADYSVDDGGKAEERAWEERLEHVGRHYERDGCRPEDENLDEDLVEWGLSAGVFEQVPDGHGNTRPWLVSATAEDPDRAKSLSDGPTSSVQARSQRKGLRSRGNDGNESRAGRKWFSHVSDSEEDASAEDE